MLEAASRTISERQTAEAQAKMSTEIGKARVAVAGAAGGLRWTPNWGKSLQTACCGADDGSRTIFLKDTAERLAQIKKMIYSKDKPAPQVLIEGPCGCGQQGMGPGTGHPVGR